MNKESDENKTPIASLGKFGLIERLTKKVSAVNKTTILGPGDDSAIVGDGDNQLLVSTDLMLEGIHFNLTYTPFKHLGYKAVIRGISDIYAMNATPEQILISLGVSARFTVEQLDELYEGIAIACEKYKVDLSGGDTTSSLTGLTIGITAVGKADKKKIVRRSGARPNDLICVTGDFGASFMGLQLLTREGKLLKADKDFKPDFSGYEYIIERQLKPEFPSGLIEELAKSDILPTSMIDVSDGLASDLLHLCKGSKTGCRIYSEKIPVDQETFRMAEEFNIDPVTAALNGGEDYELLFTVPLEDFEKAKQLTNVKIIGHMTNAEAGRQLVNPDGSEVDLHAQGWIG